MSAFPHIRFAARSDIGKKRKNNEDSFGAFPEAGIYCVADGMGGGDDGEIASAAVVRAVEAFSDSHVPPEGASYFIDDIVKGVQGALNKASTWIFGRAQEKHLTGCGSTFVGICFNAANPAEAVALNAGDSRLYRIRNKSIKQITTDHSAAELIGAKNESEINPLFRGVILRAVGVCGKVELDRTSVSLKAGDRIVLCSDGLSKMVPDRKLLSIIRGNPNADDAAKALVDSANAAGGVDNVTVIVIDVGPMPKGRVAVALPATEQGVSKDSSSSPSDADSTTATGGTTGITRSGARQEELAPFALEDDDSPPGMDHTATLACPVAKAGPRRAKMLNMNGLRAAIIVCSVLVLVMLGVICALFVQRRNKVARALEAARQDETVRATVAERRRELEMEKREQLAVRDMQSDIVRHVVPETANVTVAAQLPVENGDDVAVLNSATEKLALASQEEKALAFIRTARKYSSSGEVEALLHRFQPMRDTALPQERRRAIAVLITEAVQEIVKDMAKYASGRIDGIDALSDDFRTSAEIKKKNDKEKSRLEEFLRVSLPFLEGRPEDAATQNACADVITKVPTWFP